MMSIEQFRQSELLSAELAELLKNPTLALALQICDAVSPANGGAKPYEQEHVHVFQHGVDRGYNLYPQVLRRLAEPVHTAAPPPEPEYADVEEKE